MEFRLTRQDPCGLIVGADGKWRLCFSCARLPYFKSLRRRVPIKRPLGFVPMS